MSMSMTMRMMELNLDAVTTEGSMSLSMIVVNFTKCGSTVKMLTLSSFGPPKVLM